jgi:hypothetical protein
VENVTVTREIKLTEVSPDYWHKRARKINQEPYYFRTGNGCPGVGGLEAYACPSTHKGYEDTEVAHVMFVGPRNTILESAGMVLPAPLLDEFCIKWLQARGYFVHKEPIRLLVSLNDAVYEEFRVAADQAGVELCVINSKCDMGDDDPNVREFDEGYPAYVERFPDAQHEICPKLIEHVWPIAKAPNPLAEEEDINDTL